MEDSDTSPHLSTRTVHADRPLTINQLKTIAYATPFKASEADGAMSWKPRSCASVTIIRDDGAACWRIYSLHFRDDFGEILFWSYGFEFDGYVVETQRGSEKIYKSVDAIINDFHHVLGERGTVVINVQR